MKRKVTVRRSVTGIRSVTVRLDDGEYAVSWTVNATHGVEAATSSAHAGANAALEKVRMWSS